MVDDKHRFLYPHHPYNGEARPERILFNDHLQEFAHRTSYICNLHTGGRISSKEAFEQLQALWNSVETNKRALKIRD